MELKLSDEHVQRACEGMLVEDAQHHPMTCIDVFGLAPGGETPPGEHLGGLWSFLGPDATRHVVASVNACAGIATAGLEAEGVMLVATNTYQAVIEQRDQLQAALSATVEQRDMLLAIGKNFEIQGPDADGFVWLVLHGNGTTGKGMINLGEAGMLVVQVAQHLEADRKAAISAVEQPKPSALDELSKLPGMSPAAAAKVMAARAAKAEAAGWIEWRGGECPVDEGTIVEVQFRTGTKVAGERAGSWYWLHGGGFGDNADIIAYRIVQEGGAA